MKIDITCDACRQTFSVHRTNEIPPDVTKLFCNWCPGCEDKAQDYYDERYCYDPIPDLLDPNQLIFEF
jgi:hypothetical protein